MGWYQQPAPVLCYGLKLAPLQLGHLFLLAELNSPLVGSGESRIQNPESRIVESLWDILLAVLVCSTPHERSRQVLKSRWLPFFFWLWSRRVRKMNAFVEMNAFDDYFLAQRQMPTFNVQQEPGEKYREMTTPGHFRLLHFLLADMHQSMTEGMNMTVLLANHLWATHVDFSGKATFWTEEHDALWEYAAAEDRKRMQFCGNRG